MNEWHGELVWERERDNIPSLEPLLTRILIWIIRFLRPDKLIHLIFKNWQTLDLNLFFHFHLFTDLCVLGKDMIFWLHWLTKPSQTLKCYISVDVHFTDRWTKHTHRKVHFFMLYIYDCLILERYWSYLQTRNSSQNFQNLSPIFHLVALMLPMFWYYRKYKHLVEIGLEIDENFGWIKKKLQIQPCLHHCGWYGTYFGSGTNWPWFNILL